MRRLEPLTAQNSAVNAQISVSGKLQSSLEKLKSAALEALKNTVIATTQSRQ